MATTRREFLGVMSAAACVGALRHSGAGEAPGGKLPNVVLCMADDQGWGDMAYNGHPVNIYLFSL